MTHGQAAPDQADAIVIDAHRNRRGPYTAAGDLATAFIQRFGDVAQRAAAPRLVTLLAIRPELSRFLPVPDSVAQSLDFTREGNRRDWTLRSAHSIVEFLLDCIVPEDIPIAVTVCHAEHAEPTDLEFLEALRRRTDPARLMVTITSAAPIAASVADHIHGDCVDDRPHTLAAYDALDPEQRRALHRRRAEELEALGEPSLALGAIALHREMAGDDAAALATAARRCMHFAFYDASLDWGERACRLALRLGDQASYDSALRDRIFALLLLDRWDEGEALCDRCLAEAADPATRIHAGYAKAILAVRLRPNRDLAAARRHIDGALAAAEELTDPVARTASRAFLRNTLALILTKQGDPAAALALMDESIATLERDAPSRFAREGMILFQNRARLRVHAGREAAAMADLDRLLELEPGSAEALFDRALIHQRAGRAIEALRDYTAAMAWAPPQFETLLNRAGLLADLGEIDAAAADYDHLLAIDPDHGEGLYGRAKSYWRQGAFIEARADIDRALTLCPADPPLLCLSGLIAIGAGMLDKAGAEFDLAIAQDPDFADGWANRAILHWRRGRPQDALADLDRALALKDDPAVRRNRDKVVGALARAACSSPVAERPSQERRSAPAIAG